NANQSRTPVDARVARGRSPMSRGSPGHLLFEYRATSGLCSAGVETNPQGHLRIRSRRAACDQQGIATGPAEFLAGHASLTSTVGGGAVRFRRGVVAGTRIRRALFGL